MPSNSAPMHPVDLIRKKRDGESLTNEEIRFLVAGAAGSSISLEQLAAWLMAAWIRGLSVEETRALTVAMRDSGEKFDPSRLGKTAVDKHSTGGVGDKTSFLVAPIAAACGVVVPMISGRALGHTGGTLDKLESIPGYRTALSLREFEAVLETCGASIVSQTLTLVPADRVLYGLRDRTATVENVGLICASILSKKLAAGLNGLVLDVKTGSGAFMRRREDAERLAALMVATAEAAGTRTVALLTDMGQPLGHTAGNWIEVAECVELLRGERPAHSEDLRQLSLILAGWMIHLGGKAPSPEIGSRMAEAALSDGSALGVFMKMVDTQGGDVGVFDDLAAFHRPDVTRVLAAWESGFIADMDTTAIGWAVQRTGAGREARDTSEVPAESLGWEPVDPHAGIVFHARRGDRVEKGGPIATLYATSEAQMEEAVGRLRAAIRIADEPPSAAVPLVSRVFDRKSAEAFLQNAVKV
jgi:pyrimidine-nucleoside phosphorylase